MYNSVHYVDPSGYKWSWKKFFGIVAIVAVAVTGVGLLGELAAGSAVAATAFGTSAVGEAFLAASPAIAGWGALVGTASGIGFALTPGFVSQGFAQTVGLGSVATASVLTGGALAPTAVLANTGINVAGAYAATQILNTQQVQNLTAGATNSLVDFGVAPWAAHLFVGLAASTVVSGLLSPAQALGQKLATGNALEETVTIYRGVRNAHPGFEDALKGIAKPRGGHADVFEHNRGNTASVFTAWTTNEEVARHFAGSGGVILEKTVPKSSLIWSPDQYREDEKLLYGLITDAKVKRQ